MPEIAFNFPCKTVSEANNREHWAKKYRRSSKQRAVAKANVLQALRGNEVSLPCIVCMTRIGPKKLDKDNLQRSLKAIRDGIADAIGFDDGKESTGEIDWRYRQTPVGKRFYKVMVGIRWGE